MNVRIFLLIILFWCSTGWAQINVRFAHFAPFADQLADTAVDVTVNGMPVLEGVQFGDFSDYVNAGAAGVFEVAVAPVEDQALAFTASFDLTDGDYLAIAVGNGSDQPLELLAIGEDNSTPAQGNIKYRVIHVAPYAAETADTRVDVRTAGGELIAGLGGVGYGEASNYFEIPAGAIDLKVTGPGGLPNLIDPLPIEPVAGSVVTFLAVGDGRHRPLGITALPTGEMELRAPVDHTATGLYFSPTTSGQGFSLIAIPRQNRLLGYYYGFNDSGTEQSWYLFDSCQTPTGETGCAQPGAFDGQSASVIVKQVTGGAFNSSDEVARMDVGSGVLTFEGCDNLTFTGSFGTVDGEVTLEYIRLGDRIECFSDAKRQLD